MTVSDPTTSLVSLMEAMPMSGSTSERYMTAEELFVPGEGVSPGEEFSPMSRLILDQTAALHPVDPDSGLVIYGPRNPKENPQKDRASHPYVHIELVEQGSVVKPFLRGGKEYYVYDDELYKVTVTTSQEVSDEIKDRTHVKVTHYSEATGRVAIRIPRPEPHKQTYFPGGK
jgi:hypothetical protein